MLAADTGGAGDTPEEEATTEPLSRLAFLELLEGLISCWLDLFLSSLPQEVEEADEAARMASTRISSSSSS